MVKVESFIELGPRKTSSSLPNPKRRAMVGKTMRKMEIATVAIVRIVARGNHLMGIRSPTIDLRG
ncbi:hypothetical protein J1N35_040495 [Gossypium stocksii]|uniref:Uncharacterized protein n=1 Tax=Gossypium stocksii TaxID=47602 RepID=A0A9D3UE33_9ROSI|nr:hypothetical protein J1N35_040495 [Gossypium stocksii]